MTWDERGEASDGSVEPIEDLPSVRSEDPALRAAKANRFADFDLEVPHNVAEQAALRLRGKLRARELAELRKLLEGDVRFAVLLDRYCKAVRELIDARNPAPALTLLANLVWSSLSIAWELDTSHMPKARMKMELEDLRLKMAQVSRYLSHSRASYLKELVSHRERLRRFDGLSVKEVERLVYEEEPVMFYEPLNYLDDATKVHVAEVIEEKLKLLLTRLQVPSPPDLKALVLTPQVHEPAAPVPAAVPQRVEEDELEEKAEELARKDRELQLKEVRIKTQLEEMRAARQKMEGELNQRVEEAEARHSKTQMLASEFKANFLQAQAELTAVTKAARKDMEELSPGSELPEDALGCVTTVLRLAKMSGVQSKASAKEKDTQLEKQNHDLKAHVAKLQKEVQELKSEVARTQEELARKQQDAERQRQELESAQSSLRSRQEELQSMQKSLQKKEEKPKSKDPSVDKELQEELSRLKEELGIAQKGLEAANEEVGKAHEARRALETEVERMRRELAQSKESRHAQSLAELEEPPKVSEISHDEVESIICNAITETSQTREPPMTTPATNAQGAQIKPEVRDAATSTLPQAAREEERPEPRPDNQALRTQKGENMQLRLEVSRLQKVLRQLQEQVLRLSQGAAPEAPVDAGTAYHLGKVHERLYLDAYDRQERQRARKASLQRAQEVEVLDAFRSQHPWLNASELRLEDMSLALSLCSASIEGLEDASPKKPDRGLVRPGRLVPSPRSMPDSEENEGLPSPDGEYLPLVVCSLGGDEPRAAMRPASAPRSEPARCRGLPLGQVARRPMSAASGLDAKKLREGLQLLASKPGEARPSLKRPKSLGALRT